MNLAVDRDRDGTVQYGSRDFTSAQNPYHFWLNNDLEVYRAEAGYGTRGYWEDATDDPISKWGFAYGDATDNVIGTMRKQHIPGSDPYKVVIARDLEDFALSPLRYSTLMESSGLFDKVRIQWSGLGALRLWRSYISDVDSPSSVEHVADATAIQAIIDRTTGAGASKLSSILVGQNEVALSLDEFRQFFAKEGLRTDANGITSIPLMFEAQRTGAGKLTFTFLDSKTGTSVSETRLHLALDPPKEFYEWRTVGDNPRGGGTGESPQVSAIQDWQLTNGADAKDRAVTTDYLLLVHGWRMTKFDKESAAATAYKRLYWSGYRGTVGMFSWPTRSTEDPLFDPSNFNQSEEIAWHSAAQLSSVFSSIRSTYAGKFTVLAHSMGNVVASEALYQSHQAGVVDTYIASNAAISAHFFDASAPAVLSPGPQTDYWVGQATPGGTVYKGLTGPGGTQPRFSGLSNATTGTVKRMVNYFHVNDYATEYAWEANNSGKAGGFLSLAKGFGGLVYVRTGDPTTNPPEQVSFQRVVDFDHGDMEEITEAGNRYEVYAHLFASRSKALGATDTQAIANAGGAWGPFAASFNLGPGGLNFGDEANGHSKQFLGSYQQVGAYWEEVVADAKK